MSKGKNNKAFTLIELLAVIIILGVIMLIAIPSVTRYVSNSRKTSYIATAKRYIQGARNIVNDSSSDLFDKDTTYYIPISCIKMESGEGKSPYGDFKQAYVIVSYTGNGYDYYWASTDTANMGIYLTREKDLDEKLVNTNVNEIKTDISVLSDYKIMIIDDDNCNSQTPQEVISNFFPEGNDATNLYNISHTPRIYNFSDNETTIKNKAGETITRPLSEVFNNSFWNNTQNEFLLVVRNDTNFKRTASFEIDIPIITRKDTGEQVPIERWYYDIKIDYYTKESYHCSGSPSETKVDCVSDSDVYAEEKEYSTQNLKHKFNLYYVLSDGTYIKENYRYVNYGYYVYRDGNYIFPGSFIHGTRKEN